MISQLLEVARGKDEDTLPGGSLTTGYFVLFGVDYRGSGSR